MNEKVIKVIQWLVVLAMPFLLGLGTIRLLIATAPAYVRWEYAKESFPPDRYGFTQEERTELALVAVEYLQRNESPQEVIYLLEEQTLPDSDEPLYNQREIGHMIDVKRLTDAIGTLVWVAGVLVIGGVGVLLLRPGTRPTAYKAIMQGGVATTIVLLVIALFILLAWNIFFVQFHELLFPPDSWSFPLSDSLIRLFPEKFWFDFGVILSLTALGMGVVVTGIGYYLQKRNPL